MTLLGGKRGRMIYININGSLNAATKSHINLIITLNLGNSRTNKVVSRIVQLYNYIKLLYSILLLCYYMVFD